MKLIKTLKKELAKLRKSRYFLPTIVILLGLTFVALALNANRYYLITENGKTYKIDKWTGKTYWLTSYGFVEIQHKTIEQIRREISEKEASEPFPLNYLLTKDTTAETNRFSGDSISLTIKNAHSSLAVKNLVIRARFSKDKEGRNEVDTKDFSFTISIPPQSTKKLTSPSFSAPVSNYWYTVEIISAEVSE